MYVLHAAPPISFSPLYVLHAARPLLLLLHPSSLMYVSTYDSPSLGFVLPKSPNSLARSPLLSWSGGYKTRCVSINMVLACGWLLFIARQSMASFVVISQSFRSCFMDSSHVKFGQPRHLLILSARFNSLLCTEAYGDMCCIYPNHLRRCLPTCSLIGASPTPLFISSVWTRSFLVYQHIHLHMRICVTPNCWTCRLLVSQHPTVRCSITSHELHQGKFLQSCCTLTKQYCVGLYVICYNDWTVQISCLYERQQGRRMFPTFNKPMNNIGLLNKILHLIF